MSTTTSSNAQAAAPFHGRLLIDGDFADAADGARLERRSPAHEHLVAV